MIKLLKRIDYYNTTKVLVDCLQLNGRPPTLDYYTCGKFIASEMLKPSKTGGTRRIQSPYVAKEPLLDKDRFSQLFSLTEIA